MRWLLRWLFARFTTRQLVTIGAVLFLVDLFVPDPIPFVDEILLLAGTMLVSRLGKSQSDELKSVGRGRTTP